MQLPCQYQFQCQSHANTMPAGGGSRLGGWHADCMWLIIRQYCMFIRQFDTLAYRIGNLPLLRLGVTDQLFNSWGYSARECARFYPISVYGMIYPACWGIAAHWHAGCND